MIPIAQRRLLPVFLVGALVLAGCRACPSLPSMGHPAPGDASRPIDTHVHARAAVGRAVVPILPANGSHVEAVAGGRTAVPRVFERGKMRDHLVDLDARTVSPESPWPLKLFPCQPRMLGLLTPDGPHSSTTAIVTDDHARPLERITFHGILYDEVELTPYPLLAAVVSRGSGIVVEIWETTPPRRRAAIPSPFLHTVRTHFRPDGEEIAIEGCNDTAPPSQCRFAVFAARTGQRLAYKAPPGETVIQGWDMESEAMWIYQGGERLWDPKSGAAAAKRDAAGVAAVRRRAGPLPRHADCTESDPPRLVIGDRGLERHSPGAASDLVLPMFHGSQSTRYA